MKEARKIVRWLRVTYLFQTVLIFVVWVISTKRLSAVASSLRHSLYESGATLEQVHKVDQTFSSISYGASWIFLTGMILTNVGFGLLMSVAKKNWPKPDPPDGEGG